MTHTSEILAIESAKRHCAEYGCQKCAARARWNRRKRRHSHKNSIRRRTGRK
jgi:hypothetical protein